MVPLTPCYCPSFHGLKSQIYMKIYPEHLQDQRSIRSILIFCDFSHLQPSNNHINSQHFTKPSQPQMFASLTLRQSTVAIKHPAFLDDFPSYKPPWLVKGFSSHVWWRQEGVYPSLIALPLFTIINYIWLTHNYIVLF